MLRSVLAVVALFVCAAPVLAAPPSPDPKSLAVPPEEHSKARELVRKLGSQAFFEREDAENDLTAMGRAARAALIEGANNDPDPEIRSRCRGLLPRANGLEMKARLDTFLADTDGRYEHDLPGWTKLRATVRGDWTVFGWTFVPRPAAEKAARQLFVEFLKAPNGRELLAALTAGGRNLGPMVAGLKQDMYNMKYGRNGPQRNPTEMEVAVLLFADAHAKFTGGGVRNTTFTSVLSTSGLLQTVQGTDDKAAALRAILGAWFDTRTEPYEMYSALNLATSTQNEPAAHRLAVRLLNTTGAPGLYRAQALAALMRTSGKEQLPAIEKLIGDESMITRIGGVNGRINTITLGDMALAAAVTVTGQKLEDYHIEDRFKGSGTASINYTRYSISDEHRKEAAVKYGWWKLKESLKAAK